MNKIKIEENGDKHQIHSFILDSLLREVDLIFTNIKTLCYDVRKYSRQRFLETLRDYDHELLHIGRKYKEMVFNITGSRQTKGHRFAELVIDTSTFLLGVIEAWSIQNRPETLLAEKLVAKLPALA